MSDLLACLLVGAPLWIMLAFCVSLWVLGWLMAWLRDWYEAIEARDEGQEDE